MSETRPQRKHALRWSLAALAISLSVDTGSAIGGDLQNYGAKMCRDAGIPIESCSLAPNVEAEPGGSSDKTATLLERGRELCRQQGVPIEDCMALPSEHRVEEPGVLPTASFLTVPESLPAENIPPPPAVRVVPAGTVQERAVQTGPPPPPPAIRPPAVRTFVEAPVPMPVPIDDRRRSFREAPLPAQRVGVLPPPPLDPGFVAVDRQTVVERGFPGEVVREFPPGFREPPRRAERVRFRDVEVVEGAERFEVERFDIERPRERCFRFVRYGRPPPPSYRLVDCQP